MCVKKKIVPHQPKASPHVTARHDPHTGRAVEVEDYVSDLPHAYLCFWTAVGPVQTNFGPGGTGVLVYAHLQGLNITFLPRHSNFIQLHNRDHSPPSLHLPNAHSCPWLSLQTSDPPSPSCTLPPTSLA